MTYVALLRGINVGGNNIIKMQDLKALFSNLGFNDVQTYIQSGNVIFNFQTTDKNILEKQIEEAILQQFAMNISVVVMSFSEMGDIIKRKPATFDDNTAEYRYDVWFLKTPLTSEEVIRNIRLKDGVDSIWQGKNIVYAQRLMAKASQSYMIKLNQSPLYKLMTIRNWNTTKRLFRIMKEQNTLLLN